MVETAAALPLVAVYTAIAVAAAAVAGRAVLLGSTR